MTQKHAAVLGAGSWGTALAKVLAENDFQTRLWARDASLVESINREHRNDRYLADIALPRSVTAHATLAGALADASVVALVVPSHALRSLATQMTPYLPEGVPIVAAVKGIENESLEMPSQILEGVLPARFHAQLTYLSGPSFALEVALGVPTGVLVAGKDEKLTCAAQEAFVNQRLRVYRTDDVVGVELGGALKNVYAIMAGMAAAALRLDLARRQVELVVEYEHRLRRKLVEAHGFADRLA